MLHSRTLPLIALLASLAPLAAGAQSLRGSRASIERMYRHARAERFTFLTTSARVKKYVAAGYLVRLRPDGNFRLHDVDFPYVRPATRTFVVRLAAQYRDACGEELVVTSAVRPTSRQPGNSTAHSVHPTGMAVDLRKPDDPKCRDWLRDVLLSLEKEGLLEATEEFYPPHFHVAVFPTPYRDYVEERQSVSSDGDVQLAGEPAEATVATYTVRRGDTLWGIARAHRVTVDAIREANGLGARAIRPGQRLRIPVAAD